MSIALDLTIALAGLLLLVWGAERFVHGAGGLARSLGVSTLVIGLTVVSLGTSAPELLVNLTAQLTGVPAMAFGNVVGSNIANIGLVLGISAVLLPLTVHSKVLRREFPLLLGVTVLLGALIMDEALQPLEGFLLTLGLAAYAYWILRDSRRSSGDPFLEEVTEDVPEALPLGKALLWLFLGLGALILGSRGLVYGATEVAELAGMSDLVIGLTLVAFGTSLPELAASLAAVAKKEDDLVVGNVVGSCLLNILLVLGLPAMIGGMPAGPDAIVRDLPVLIGLTLLLGPLFINGPRGLYRINRLEGGVLVAAYVAYISWIIHSSLTGVAA
ncbi:calcium/sodium antiporter [Thiohalorhabdus methylotrophus]|uniref:Calcium/sodium antiporter n=1 Tax=Thiohalorhabdus methylotrophus TaxID=3242694 RepID=A0ABV4TVF5_9GAMM